MKKIPGLQTLKRGFTLLEMMVVIAIIGILSTYLVVQIPEMVDSAKMTGSEQNMSRIFKGLLRYQSNHNGQWPSDAGQKFFLRPWKDGMVEKTESNAMMFFSPAETFEDLLAYEGRADEGLEIVDYLNDWDAIGPGYTSYAGFNSSGDREIYRQLKRNPGLTTIVSDAHLVHRFAMIYLTGDGNFHRMLVSDMEDEYGYDFEAGDDVMVGPGCEVEEFQTVTND